MEELIPLFQSNKIRRQVREGALNEDNEIALFDNDLIRLMREVDAKEYSLITDIVFIKAHHNEILKQILDDGFMLEIRSLFFLLHQQVK